MKKRLLVVDDDPDIVEMLTSFLEATECDIVKAASADAALSLLSAGQFCGLVVDLLAHSDGLNVIAEFRAKYSEAPIVLFTGWIDGDVTERGLHAGANVVLFKPLEIGELLRVLNQLLRLH